MFDHTRKKYIYVKVSNMLCLHWYFFNRLQVLLIWELSSNLIKKKWIDDKRLCYLYYYITLLGGNEKGYFRLIPETGDLILTKRLDREEQSVYLLDIQATNNISDYTVIRSRRRRAMDPSIATWRIQIKNANDVRPDFTQNLYHGCKWGYFYLWRTL